MAKKRNKAMIRQVAKNYIKGLNMTKALQEAEGNIQYKHENYKRVKASRWFLSDEFKEELRRQLATFDRSLIKDDYVYMNLMRVINDEKAKKSDIVNACSLLAKCLNMTKDGQNQNIAIFNDQLQALKDKRLNSINDKDLQHNNIVDNKSNNIDNVTSDNSSIQ